MRSLGAAPETDPVIRKGGALLEWVGVDGAGQLLGLTPKAMRARSIRTAFAAACRRAGLVGVTPHVLRHTFTSRLVMAGVNIRAVQELGGWSSLDLV